MQTPMACGYQQALAQQNRRNSLELALGRRVQWVRAAAKAKPAGPRGTNIDVSYAAGTIDVSYAASTIDVSYAAGTIDVSYAASTIDVSYAAGTIAVRVKMFLLWRGFGV
jgi:hypothetical protein